MPGLFSRLKARDGAKSRKKDAAQSAADLLASQPKWTDAYARTTVEPEEIHELIHCCTVELKTQALDIPFLLLPFRPTSDPSAVRTFIRHYFQQNQPLRGDALLQELRMTEPMVIAGVLKWCWSRLQGGVVGWDAYDLFKVGEHDSNMARDSFKTFIPISVENGARQRIIFDFFDLIAAVAAHGKRNGFGGYKLSRLAAWWAFEHQDTKDGFDGGYKAWLKAADATSHLFFAYLRSLCPEQKVTGITLLPKSLETLLRETPYPPPRRSELMVRTDKVVMIVDAVSPTPFALLRRAKHFQYRDSDRALQEFSEYEDPVQALTEECRRVLKAISGANQSHVSSTKHSTSLRDASWSRFEDIGFSSALDDDDDEDSALAARRRPQPQGLRTTPMSGNGLARPTTPSWADFLSTGFVDDHHPDKPNMLLPPDKVLPPIDTETRQHSSQSHRPRLESNKDLEPGELASITSFSLDDAFWWVWMSSLAPEETPERKSAFGRCAVVEANIRSGRWLVMEEMIAGAAPEPQEGAYITGKKGFFSWTKRSKTVKAPKASRKQGLESDDKNISKASIGPDTHAKVQAKAAQLRAQETLEKQLAAQATGRRGRTDAELMAEKTNSVFTLQSNIVGEASPAMKWVKTYDKSTIKEAYMANNNAGRGLAMSPVPSEAADSFVSTNGARTEQLRSPQAAGFHSSPASPMLSPPPQPREPLSPVSAVSVQRKEVPPPPVEQDPEPEEFREQASPPPPPKDKALPDIDREDAMTPEPTDTSPDGKRQHKKLHKEKGGGGFRKLFGRKNRASKLPENAAADVRDFLQANPRPSDELKPHEAPLPVPPSPQTAAPAPVPVPPKDEPVEEAAPVMPVSPISTTAPADLPTPKPAHSMPQSPRELQVPEARYEPSVEESPSPVDARDAAEAKAEFSRFDQGPLSDQPAFVPDGSDDEDDATPPPIARRPIPVVATRKPVPDKGPEEKLGQAAGPGIQDRWAQIRKNAAERAAQRQVDDFRGGQPKPSEGDDDTSGEETIESRVARIKARVAELTGSMEGTSAPGAPGAPQPIPGRR